MRPLNEQKIMDIIDTGALEKARRLARVLVDKKIRDVWVIDVAGVCSYADCLILGDAENERHMQSALERMVLLRTASEPPFRTTPFPDLRQREATSTVTLGRDS